MPHGFLHQHREETDTALLGPPRYVRVQRPGRHRPQHDRPQLPADDPALPQEMFKYYRYYKGE